MQLMLVSEYRLNHQRMGDLLFKHYLSESNDIILTLSEMTDKDNDKLLSAIKSVSNSQVDEIDISKFQCKSGNKVFSVVKLGTAEQMFLVAEMATILKRRCAFLHTMRELSDTNLDRFIRRYKTSDIILLEDNESTVNYIRVSRMIEEIVI